MGQRVYPPGGEDAIRGQMDSDQKTVDALGQQATAAQKLQSTTQATLGLLDGVTTGKLGELAGNVSGWLKALGMPDDLAQKITGSTAPNRDILIKNLLQQAATQMAGSGQGVGLFTEFLGALPSIETSKDAIKMFENMINMQAQRTIDNANQATDYHAKTSNDYAYGRAQEYYPLSTFQRQFDKENPETNYYHAAQMMSPAFAKEGYQAAADTGTTDQVLKLIPKGATFTDANGTAMRRNAKGDIVPVQPAARAPAPAPGPAPAPAPGGAQAAPTPGGPLAVPGLPGSSATAPIPPPPGGISPSTIQTWKDSGISDEAIARILGAPSAPAPSLPVRGFERDPVTKKLVPVR